MATENCEKVLTVPKGQGIKLILLHFKGSQRLMVYDSSQTVNLIVDKSNNGITTLVHKEVFIPRDAILLKWSGDVNSKVALQAEVINISGKYVSFCFFLKMIQISNTITNFDFVKILRKRS